MMSYCTFDVMRRTELSKLPIQVVDRVITEVCRRQAPRKSSTVRKLRRSAADCRNRARHMAASASLQDIVAHKFIETKSNRLHYVELGSGPTVLLLHGFPDFWYSFRYQIPFLAASGFHVVAPDFRGFGESGVPASVDKFTALHQVGDLIALLDALQVKQALVVGHDWGSVYAADLCLMRPDRVKAVVFLSVPYMPNDPNLSPVKSTIEAFGEQMYTVVFQKPGQAEALFAKSTSANILKGFFLRWHLSPNFQVPRFFTDEDPEALPQWFTEEDVKFYAETFDRSGFTGGFNHYRALEINQELRAPWAFASIATPCMTIMARNDFVYKLFEDFMHSDELKAFLPNHQKFVTLENAAHFMHQERHEETNELLLDFLQQYKD
ncbi:hypothetical protein Mapa_010306 [Marchantia paleacea]|nr:hypothetical protein Mapa_010306 [Marchantia paleacea]